MNVAIHLTYNGYQPVVVSRVGNDDLGKELLQFLESKQVSTQWIQQGETHLTGVVKANISNKNEVTYKIVMPVAWDYIQYDEQVARLVGQSDAFIYGSLAARSPETENTLLQYLPQAKLKVFDVNLRPPHYTPEKIKQLLHLADIAKMNHQELEEIIGWFGFEGNEQEQMQFVKQEFGLKVVLVTRGECGAAILDDEGYTEDAGCKVEVEDTIGSGDAFLATFLKGYLEGTPVSDILKRACLVGAYVATQKGATGEYDPETIEEQIRRSPERGQDEVKENVLEEQAVGLNYLPKQKNQL